MDKKREREREREWEWKCVCVCVCVWRPFGKCVISLHRMKCRCFKDKYYFWATHRLECSVRTWVMRECAWDGSHCGPSRCKTRLEMLLNPHRALTPDSAQLNNKVAPPRFPWEAKAGWWNHQQTRERKCRFGPCKSHLREVLFTFAHVTIVTNGSSVFLQPCLKKGSFLNLRLFICPEWWPRWQLSLQGSLLKVPLRIPPHPTHTPSWINLLLPPG